MPGPQLKTLEVACPACGHLQPEPPTAYSTVCGKCGKHFRLEQVLHPAAKPERAPTNRRVVECFQCGTRLEVPETAVSTMCRRCSSYVDLSDYQVNQTVTKSFRTHGRLIVEPKGYLLNTDAVVGDAIVKGRVIGKLTAQRTLEVHTTARLEGAFTARLIVIPVAQSFHRTDILRAGNIEIRGELVGDVCVSGVVKIRAGGRCFGNIQAADLVVEDGAVLVGQLRIGKTSSC